MQQDVGNERGVTSLLKVAYPFQATLPSTELYSH